MQDYICFSLKHRSLLLLISGLICVCILSSCDSESSKNQKKQQDLKKEVIDIHDEIMPQMRIIGELKEQLTAIEDKFVESSGDQVSEKVSELRKIEEQLEQAEQSMREWMQGFKMSFPEETSNEEMVEYYKQEKARIESVKIHMTSSIDSAESFIETNLE